MAVADTLVNDLEAQGFKVLIDRRDLPFGVEWQRVLQEFIIQADAVVWLVSELSLTSRWCNWEVGEVERLSKRLIPIRIAEVSSSQMLQPIKKLHVLPAQGTYAPSRDLKSLVEALIQDWDWLQEHTRLIALAERWLARERQDALLLNSADVEAVDALVARRPISAPTISEALFEIRAASHARIQQELDVRRRTAGRAFVGPAMDAISRGLHDHAIRLVTAGAIVADDPEFLLVPQLAEPTFRAVHDNRLMALLNEHTGALRSVAFSPDGSKVLTASEDGSARIWTSQTGRSLVALEGHTKPLTNAAFASDGLRVVTTSQDRSAVVWDARTGGRICLIEGHEGVVNGAAFSPDGDRVLTASNDMTARIWDARSGNPVSVLAGHSVDVVVARFSPQGERVVTASSDASARVWDAETGTELLALEGGGHGLDRQLLFAIHDASFCAHGERVVTAARNQIATIWNSRTGEQLVEFGGHSAAVNTARFDAAGKRVITAANDGTVRIWDAETGCEMLRLDVPEGPVNGAVFSADGHRALAACSDGTARLWDTHDGTEIAAFVMDRPVDPGHLTYWDYRTGRMETNDPQWDLLPRAEFDPTGSRVVTGARDGTARVWNARTGWQIALLDPLESHINSIEFSPDGKCLLIASNCGSVTLSDAETGAHLESIESGLEPYYCANFSPDGSRIAVSDMFGCRIFPFEFAIPEAERPAIGGLDLIADEDAVYSIQFSPEGARVATAAEAGRACIWDAETGELLLALDGHDDLVTSASFSPDGIRILTASIDGTARVWDAETGEQILLLDDHNALLTSAAFSPNGQFIATAGSDGCAQIWHAKDGRLLRSLKGHEKSLNSIVFSPEGLRICTASDDQTARIWDASSGYLITRLEGHKDGVMSVAFNPNGDRLATGARDGCAIIWDISRSTCLQNGTAALVSAALENGIGVQTPGERDVLLLEGVPSDLLAAFNTKWLGIEGTQEFKERSAQRERTARILNAQPHANLYLAPSVSAARIKARSGSKQREAGIAEPDR